MSTGTNCDELGDQLMTIGRRVASNLGTKLGQNAGMAGAKGRNHRSGVAHHVRLVVRVEPHNAQAAVDAARARGISLAAYIDMLLERETKATEGQQQLPLTA